MRKPAFCLYENKGAYQLHGNSGADQSLYFRNPKFQAFSHVHSPDQYLEILLEVNLTIILANGIFSW